MNPVNFVCGNLIPASQYAEDLIDLLRLYKKHVPDPPAEIAEAAEEIDLEFLIEDFPQILSSMQVGTERISKIVQSLKHFSRLEDKHLSPINIQQGIESTLMILQPRLKAKGSYPGVEIIKDYEGLSDRVIGFGGLLNQVFMNLLGNAIDAVEEKYRTSEENCESSPVTGQPTLWITTTTEGDCAKISIRDNGKGIPEAVRDRIFDSFFTTKPTGKGTGLGLSISHEIIVRKHHGTLDCHSIPNEGTEFIIKIPLIHPEA
ncbi:MAG: HAMP domain-containing histidine kinase [Kamptonema sp. SIO4C4]|nr:HAMP domain-containing histidine kinase [Kamptonema sp. SIO4C4]